MTSSLIATKLGDRYRLDKRLGGGGQGEVFLGFDEKINRPVAIKLLKTSDSDSEAQRQALLQEAIATAKFEHANVVRIFDFQNPDDGLPFLVMEYLEGPTVDKLPLPLDSELLALLVKNVCSALKKAHKQGLVHRDLKPGNLMLVNGGTDEQHFVILDLGIAKLTDRDKLQVHSTHSGAGTPLYMPPEQIDGESVDFRSDIYAFGTMLFECLTGRCPFGTNDTPIGPLLKAVCSAPPPSLKKIHPQGRFSSELEQLVRDCLEKAPDRRPQSMQEVAERFHLATLAPPESPRQPPRSRRWLWGMAAFMLSIIAGVEIYRNPTTNAWLLSVIRPVSKPPATPLDELARPPVAKTSNTEPIPVPPLKHPVSSMELAAVSELEIPKVSGSPKPSVEPIPDKKADAETPFTNSIGMTFVRINPGTFLMGSADNDPDAMSRERPQHKVTFDQAFYMGVYEVTQSEYQEVMGINPSHSQGDLINGQNTRKFPVEQVSWQNAKEFCVLLSNRPAEQAADCRYRLPTEAEWEYACRAGSDTRFPLGYEFSPEFAWFDKDSPARVGSCRPNAWGLYDMQGNVWELCADFFDDRYYVNSPLDNPPGPGMAHLAEKLPGNENDDFTGKEKVMRGRSFADSETKYFRFAYRTYLGPTDTDKSIGFRVVCDRPTRMSP